MSLIADALRSAQEERTGQTALPDTAQRRRSVASLLHSGAHVYPTRRTKARRDFSRPLVASLGLLTVAAVAGAFIVAEMPELVDPDAVGIDLGTGEIPTAPIAWSSTSIEELSDVSIVEAAVDRAAAPVLGLTRGSQAFAATGTSPGTFADDPIPIQEADAPASSDVSAASDQTPSTREPPPGRFEITIGETAPARPSFAGAVTAQRLGDYDEAIRLYRDLLDAEPNNLAALNNLGASHQARGDLDSARAAFETALAIDPEYVPARTNLGLVLGSLGLESEALAALVEAVRLQPDDPSAGVNLALLYGRLGRQDDSLGLLTGVLRTNPDHVEAHYAIARLFDEMGDPSGAVTHYRHFLSLAGTRFEDLRRPISERITLLESTNGR